MFRSSRITPTSIWTRSRVRLIVVLGNSCGNSATRHFPIFSEKLRETSDRDDYGCDHTVDHSFHDIVHGTDDGVDTCPQRWLRLRREEPDDQRNLHRGQHIDLYEDTLPDQRCERKRLLASEAFPSFSIYPTVGWSRAFQKTTILKVPKTARTSGTCDEPKSTMKLTWTVDDSDASPKSENHENNVIVTFEKKESEYSILSIKLDIYMDQKTFPDVYPAGKRN